MFTDGDPHGRRARIYDLATSTGMDNGLETKRDMHYSLLGIFETFSSERDLIEIECLIIKHVALSFIPDKKVI